METALREIELYIEKNRAEMLKLWEEIVNTESGSSQIEGVNQVGSILAREMKKVGMEVRVVPMERAGNLLIGEWNQQSTKAPILFIGHMDTVFKEGVVKENPFRIDDQGHAHGPGVLDMKGGLVIALYAIKALKAAGYRDRPIKCIFAGDEEVMHKDSNTDEIMALESRGAIAAFNFETGYLDDGLVVGRKGGGIISITVKGVAVHSGIAPEKGRSAVLEAAHKIIALEQQNDIPRGKLINCGMVRGGIGENTIPGECVINIGFRFPTMAIKEEIMAAIEETVNHSYVEGTEVHYEVKMSIDCMETTEGVMKLFEHVKKSAVDCGYGAVHPISIGGISDSSITVVNGVPTVCGMGCRGNGNHTDQEYALVESLFQRCLLAATAVYKLDWQDDEEV
ncbi:M20 family metallopeptidase [Alkaliphilus crotonatoxidans]